MPITGLEALFSPRRVAIFDVSDEEGDRGAEVFKHLVWQGFQGSVYPVNPNRESVFGIETYPDLLSIPKPLDLAVITGDPPCWLPQLEECRRKGVRAVMIFGPDYKDRLKEAENLSFEISSFVKRAQIRLLGPNTLGFIRPSHRLNLSLFPGRIPPGNLAFLSDSATLAAAILDWLESKNVGLSFFVSLGEKLDVDLPDLIDFLALDPSTKAIVVYLERIKSGRKFMSAARAFTRLKPLMVVKAGGWSPRGESLLEEFALEARVYEAAFKRAGIVQVQEISELFYVAESLSKQPRPKGPRLAIVTNAGGPSKIAKDTLKMLGGELARLSKETLNALSKLLGRPAQNPVDLLSDATSSLYREALRLVLKDPEVDGVLVIFSPVIYGSPEDVAWAVVRAQREFSRKPVLVSFMGERRIRNAQQILTREKIPFFMTPAEAVKSFFYMYRYDHHLKLLFETPGTILENFSPNIQKAEEIISKAKKIGTNTIKGEEAKALLEAYGFDFQKSGASQKLEVFLAAKKDPTFGMVILFGLGGPFLRALKDYAIGLPPLNQTLARRLLEETKIYSYLQENEPRLCFVLEEALVRFSHLLVDFPELEEVFVHPVKVEENGLFVEEAIFKFDPSYVLPKYLPRGHFCPAHLAICPYPNHFTFEVCLPDGSEILIRPIKPEDEPLLRELFYTFSEETIRLRFMQPKKTVSHEELARYCQIDYDRELALVAVKKENGRERILGVVRLVRLPDEISAEMAVVVGDPWQGKGLGKLLCETALSIAKDVGLSRIYMDILAENHRMLNLARKLGFKIIKQEEDIIRVELTLN